MDNGTGNRNLAFNSINATNSTNAIFMSSIVNFTCITACFIHKLFEKSSLTIGQELKSTKIFLSFQINI